MRITGKRTAEEKQTGISHFAEKNLLATIIKKGYTNFRSEERRVGKEC